MNTDTLRQMLAGRLAMINAHGSFERNRIAIEIKVLERHPGNIRLLDYSRPYALVQAQIEWILS